LAPLVVEGIVFDLDATLVNLGGFVEWEEAHRRAAEAYIACGCPEDLIHHCSEKGLFSMLNLVRDELSKTLPSSEVERIQLDVYRAVESCEAEGVARCHLMPECLPSLEWLREMGMKMGVATSNSEGVAERILEIKGIRSYFTALVGRRAGLRMKPYPDQILRCLEEMDVEPAMGVIVGDSVRDVRAAKSAGVYAIAVPSHFTRRRLLEEAGVDRVIEHLGELPRVVSELNHGQVTG
jgi:phosphoglycolate phosphatase